MTRFRRHHRLKQHLRVSKVSTLNGTHWLKFPANLSAAHVEWANRSCTDPSADEWKADTRLKSEKR